jgi:DNA-binding NarL/FixJ family response regulator
LPGASGTAKLRVITTEEPAMTATLSSHQLIGRSRIEPRDGGSDPIRLLIVDDHPAVLLGERALLDGQPDMRVVVEARTVEEALGRINTSIDVAVLDYHFRHGADGLAAIPRLRLLQPAARVLVYSAFADAALAVAALVAGADGLLGKHVVGDELCDVIRRLARGRPHFPAIPPAVAQAMGARLGSRDQAIFAMLLYGVDSTKIAERLSITEQELAGIRVSMLRMLRPREAELGASAQRAVPLDYERVARARPAA